MELFAVVTVEVSAHMEKPRVRAGVRSVMSALTGCCGIGDAVHLN